ncbi:MAG: NRDE family protein, partial [Steroidobacteraceae bacterium]
MCLLVLAWKAHPRYRLVVAANRDEYHDRAAAPLSRWSGPPDILAGRDLRAGGTWLGLDRHRRFGVVTNFRELARAAAGAPTRGGLIPQYLGGAAPPGEYLAGLEGEAAGYGGFNLLLADVDSLWYASNRSEPFARALT